MSNVSAHLDLLRGLSKEELQQIPDRCDWCRVRDTDIPIADLSIRIRDSIDRNDITYKEAMTDIRLNVIRPGPESVTQKIRKTLRETPVAKSAGGGSSGDSGVARESYYTAQLYGALSNTIIRPYTVRLEYELDQQYRPTPDIYVESENNDGDYVIEIKRASANLEAGDISRQLQKYHRAIRQNRNRSRRCTFLCIVGEDEQIETIGESRKSTPLSEYMDVPHTIDDLSDELDRVEVISSTYKRR